MDRVTLWIKDTHWLTFLHATSSFLLSHRENLIDPRPAIYSADVGRGVQLSDRRVWGSTGRPQTASRTESDFGRKTATTRRSQRPSDCRLWLDNNNPSPLVGYHITQSAFKVWCFLNLGTGDTWPGRSCTLMFQDSQHPYSCLCPGLLGPLHVCKPATIPRALNVQIFMHGCYESWHDHWKIRLLCDDSGFQLKFIWNVHSVTGLPNDILHHAIRYNTFSANEYRTTWLLWYRNMSSWQIPP